MKAVILAGGLGTRLRAIVADRPKPMAEICGKPFLHYLVSQLRVQGVTELVLCVGYGAGSIREYFADGRDHGVRITYAEETEPLGTAGALRNAGRALDSTFLLLNGDSYLKIAYPDLVAFHSRCRVDDPRTLGTLAAVAASDVAGYGTLEVDERGRIVRFEEKVGGGVGWINAGIYVLEPAILEPIPEGRPVSIERETLPLGLRAGKRLFACRVAGTMVDIGTPAGFARFEAYVRSAPADDSQSWD